MNTKSITSFRDTDVVYLLAGVSVVLPLVAILLLYLFRRRCCRARIQSRPRRIPNSSSFQEHNRISMYAGDPENDHLEVFADEGNKKVELNEKEAEEASEEKDDEQPDLSEAVTTMTNSLSGSMSQHGTSSTMLPHCIIENKSQTNEAYESEDDDIRKNGDATQGRYNLSNNGVLVGILQTEFIDIDGSPTQDILQKEVAREGDETSTAVTKETVEALSLMEDVVNHCEEETTSTTPSDSEPSTSEEPVYNILVTSHEDAVTSSDSEVEMYMNIRTGEDEDHHKSEEVTTTQSGSTPNELLNYTIDGPNTSNTVEESPCEVKDEVSSSSLEEPHNPCENNDQAVESQVEAVEDEAHDEIPPGTSSATLDEHPSKVQDEALYENHPDHQSKVDVESFVQTEAEDSAKSTVEIKVENIYEVEDVKQCEERRVSETIEEAGIKYPTIDFTQIEVDVSQCSSDQSPVMGDSLANEDSKEDDKCPLADNPYVSPEDEYIPMEGDTESPYEVTLAVSADDDGHSESSVVERNTNDHPYDYVIPKSLISTNDTAETVSEEINHYDYVPIQKSSDNIDEKITVEQNMTKDDKIQSPDLSPEDEYVAMNDEAESPYEVTLAVSADDDGHSESLVVERNTNDHPYDYVIPKSLISTNDTVETVSEEINHYDYVPIKKSSDNIDEKITVEQNMTKDDKIQSPDLSPEDEYVAMNDEVESPYEVTLTISAADDTHSESSIVEPSANDQPYSYAIPESMILADDPAKSVSEEINHYDVPTQKSSSIIEEQETAKQNVENTTTNDIIRSQSTDDAHLSANQHAKHVTYINTPWRSLDGDVVIANNEDEPVEVIIDTSDKVTLTEPSDDKQNNATLTTADDDYAQMDVNAIKNLISAIPPQLPQNNDPDVILTSNNDITQDKIYVNISTKRPSSVKSVTSDDEKDNNYVNVTKELSVKLQENVNASASLDAKDRVNPHQSIITKLVQKVTPTTNEPCDSTSLSTSSKSEKNSKETTPPSLKPQESLLEDYTPMHPYRSLDPQISSEEDYEVMNAKPPSQVKQITPPPTKRKPSEHAVIGSNNKPTGTRLTIEESTPPSATSLVSHFESIIKSMDQ